MTASVNNILIRVTQAFEFPAEGAERVVYGEARLNELQILRTRIRVWNEPVRCVAVEYYIEPEIQWQHIANIYDDDVRSFVLGLEIGDTVLHDWVLDHMPQLASLVS